MGFGGGGSGSFVLPNHDHTNVLADGGALDEAVSLINDGAADVTMLAWIQAILTARAPTVQSVTLGASTSTTSAAKVDVTGMSITLPNVAGGKWIATFVIDMKNNNTAAWNSFQLVDGGTVLPANTVYQTHAINYDNSVTMCATGSCDGQVLKLQYNRNVGTLSVMGAGQANSTMHSLEVYA